ncbi:MAG TPA: tannase/feruloyl esterase family alpha/beta hydrolase [Candidatus Acidoferrales bacterium]|nr:tannase/feruloyl esterase family alpha/beta hydrolase [Candidatus Acidoferrales bacterium]
MAILRRLRTFAICVGALVVIASAAVLPASADGVSPTCVALTTDPANGIISNPAIKSATSVIVPASGPNVAYCKVSLLYGTNPDQNINIVVGLPLSNTDGGSGGVQGAWNGRTQGLGGGGCAGNLTVTPAVNAGYVGSGTNLGHSGGDCTPGVNPDGTYNLQFIEDFIRNAIKQQVLWSKLITKAYYSMRPEFNYWNGCSTGGRQGLLLAQELPDELDGILADAPAMYWTRFQTAQMWGQIVMKDLVGGPIAKPKLDQARASAIAACDANDGVVDGIIDDPRKCHFSAKSNICGRPGAPATNCVTDQEAEAIDLIWDGPRNADGDKIWFGLDRGTDFTGPFPGFGLDGSIPFFLGVIQFQWDEHDLNFNWETVPESGYPQVAQDGSRNIADVTDTFGPLDEFKRHGGKMITSVGANDQLIFPRGVINYYREMAARYSDDGDIPDFDNLQRFYRLFRAPGVGHCGSDDVGAWPQNGADFQALINWVEKDIPPSQIVGATAPGVTPALTRPLCPYPQTAIYNGTGDTNNAANYVCGGNLETHHTVCADVLVKYKHEVNGPLDYKGTGVGPEICERRGPP